MANRSVFASTRGRLSPKADATTAHGTPAYSYAAPHALAQMAVTGSFGGAYYAKPEMQLDRVLSLAGAVEPAFLARTAIHARRVGRMKDMPAVLLAVLASRDPALFRAVFGRVVANGRMLRTFVQILRSGRTGRKSLGSAPKAMVAGWLTSASDRALLEAAIGTSPSLKDVIRMVHPKPDSREREALFAWILGRPCEAARLPQAVRDWIAFQEAGPQAWTGPLPEVPFQMLTQAPLTQAQWAGIARNGSWQMLRQGLNMLLRHGAFEDPETVAAVAARLSDPERIEAAGALPYQLLAAIGHVDPRMPGEIVEALHLAMDHAVRRAPALEGAVVVCPDVSASMLGSVTGVRKGATSAMRHVDLAGLVAAAILRRNPRAEVLPFARALRPIRLEPRDTVASNARRLAEIAGGGTDCSAPLRALNARGARPDLVVMISDNQSWIDAAHAGRGTATMTEWLALRARHPSAKLVCIDIAPYGTTQAAEVEGVLNVGGFSDAVFDQIGRFARGEMHPDRWMAEIEAIAL
ncbi:RNA-binding protein [Albimonas sp. CAU 1670]|uniref:vWA domain-containing protein n=1 Tax=Albimonas sp. CAU 1670 TaxID=3032599 RepID=UPI0023DA34B5|nr:RNA-binding protein [Albimonas sp. CAU 1670]MDF2231246.1 RNA-binding protein [Albimonas sp. CAU 1670]